MQRLRPGAPDMSSFDLMRLPARPAAARPLHPALHFDPGGRPAMSADTELSPVTSLVDLGPAALRDDADRDADTAQVLRDYLAARALTEPA